jgi:hypothetical protein
MQRLLKTAENVGRVCIRVQPAQNGSMRVVDHAADDQESIDSYMALLTRPSEPDDPRPRESEPSLGKIGHTHLF